MQEDKEVVRERKKKWPKTNQHPTNPPSSTVININKPRRTSMAESGEQVVFQAGSDDLTHEEIWDDTLLIQQYDEAMAQVALKLAQRPSGANTESEQSEASHVRGGGQGQQQGTHNTNRKKKKKNKKGTNWHTGDYCRARYTEDGEWYEAAITTINPHTARCTVRYLGYNNEEELPLSALHKSKGETARRRQQETAACDALSEMDQCSSVAESDQQSDTDCERNNKRQRLPPNRNSPRGMMPPPNHPAGDFNTPPPHLPLLPPPPALTLDASGDPQSSEALHTMLMSWYMTGYHTGYYQGLQHAQGRRRNQ